jgi:hypothetical protein
LWQVIALSNLTPRAVCLLAISGAVVAEAQLFLDRIAQFKAAVIDRSLGGLELSKEIGEITEALSVTAVDEVSGLSSLKRYERNAQARWVKAVRAFEAYQDRATQ